MVMLLLLDRDLFVYSLSSIVFGLRLVWVSGRGSVEAWYTSSLDIEEVLAGASDSHVHLFVADVVKSFDTVDRAILDLVLSSLGLAGWFRHAYFEYHAHVRMKFKLPSGLGALWTRDGGNNRRLSQEFPCFLRHLFTKDPSWQPVLSAAQRRKQRRLRSWWRHEQQSIAAALATYSHHSALRGQKTARAGEEDNEMHFTATFRANPPPQAAGMDVDELPAAGTRPDRLVGVRPQERVQRHTVEHIVDSAPVVPSLDAPVPLVAEQLVDVLSLVAEYETEMDRLEDRILQGSPVSTADREAWRRWVNNSSSSGSKRKKKKRRKRKLPKAGWRPGLRRGRPCDHAAPVPAVFVEYVEVPQLQFLDSVVVQLLHRDRDAQCKLCRRPSSFFRCRDVGELHGVGLITCEWEESSMVTKVPLTESRRLLVIMESPS